MKSIYLVFCLTNEDKQAIEHAFQNIKTEIKETIEQKTLGNGNFTYERCLTKDTPGMETKKSDKWKYEYEKLLEKNQDE